MELLFILGFLIGLALLFLLVVILSSLPRIIRMNRSEKLRKNKIEEMNRELATRRGQKPISFALLLRSTQTDQLFSGRNLMSGNISDKYYEDLETHQQLRAHLFESLSPVALLAVKNREFISHMPAAEYPENKWQSEVTADFVASKLLLLIPLFPSVGLRWEIEQLLLGQHLDKCFIVMPPADTLRLDWSQNWRYHSMIADANPAMSNSERNRKVEQWRHDQACRELQAYWASAKDWLKAEFGISIPEYSAAGGLLAHCGEKAFRLRVTWRDISGEGLIHYLEGRS